MVLDYHLHLWEHGPRPLEATLEQVAEYCAAAAENGVTEIAVTEHLYRFRQADSLLHGWWDDVEEKPVVRAAMRRYWDGETGADLDHYVEVVLAAKACGLPVVLGLEVDHYAGRMDEVGRLLDGYPFDVLLGSVHWLGAWGFDNHDHDVFGPEWDERAIDDVWRAYTDALDELAASGACDVLAHPDLVKIRGRYPSPAAVDEAHHRMSEIAARSDMAAEVSSAGWFKPVGEAYPAPTLLQRFHAAGVPITTASDAHHLDRVAVERPEVRRLVESAGYDRLCAFDARAPREVPL